MSSYNKLTIDSLSMSLDNVIVSISERLNNYGAYTFNSKDIQAWRQSVAFYACIYDFLHEYIDGNEDTELTDLVDVLRMSLSSTDIGAASVIKIDKFNSLPSSTEDIILLVNNTEYNDQTPIVVNTNQVLNIEAVYNGTSAIDYLEVNMDTLTIADELGNVYINGYYVQYSGSSVIPVICTVHYQDQTTTTKTFSIVIFDAEQLPQ